MIILIPKFDLTDKDKKYLLQIQIYSKKIILLINSNEIFFFKLHFSHTK